MDREWHELVTAAVGQGWAVRPLRKHGVMLMAPDGVGKVTLTSTPSDWRAIHKVVAIMRRYGFVWHGR